jgi:hypothetical protein
MRRNNPARVHCHPVGDPGIRTAPFFTLELLNALHYSGELANSTRFRKLKSIAVSATRATEDGLSRVAPDR